MAQPENQEQMRARRATDNEQMPQEPYYQRGRRARSSQSPRSSLGMALVIIGLIWLAVSVVPGAQFFGAPGGRANVVAEQTLSGKRLLLEAGSADVELERAGGTAIHVVATRKGGDDSDFQVSIAQDGDTVRVSHTARPCFLFCFRELSYRVELPAGASADVRTASGSVSAQDIDGSLALQTASGDIELHDLRGQMTAESVSGDIALDDGNVGGANVRTVSGDIKLRGVAQAVVVQTVSGDIDVEGRDAATLTLDTTSGDIEYQGQLMPESANRVNSISGDVTLALPAASSFNLDASTVSGDIANRFDLTNISQTARQLQGQAGSGDSQLTITTTSGNIELQAR